MEFAPVAVTSHDAPAGRWEIASRRPSPLLRPYVRRIMGYIEYNPVPVRKEFPSTDVVLIITLGSHLAIRYPSHPGGSIVVKHAFGGGLIDSAIVTEASGLAMGMQVNFSPIGGRLFYGLPMTEITNRSVELDDLLGHGARALVDRINDAPDWDSRFAILETAIARRFAAASVRPDGVDWALRQLHGASGACDIAVLRDALGWSPRKMIDEFREHTGLPPKSVARIVRFEGALARLNDNTTGRLADIASDSGYYDQAHFNREFRSLAGVSPGQYLRDRAADPLAHIPEI